MADNKLALFFLFGVLQSAACGSIIDDLKKEIKLVKDQTSAVQANNRGLQTRIQSLPDEYKKKILNVTIEKYNVSAEIKEEWKIAHKLILNVTLLDSGIKETKLKALDFKKELSKLEFFIEWISQVLVNLKLRKSKKENEKCLELMYSQSHHNHNATHGKRCLQGSHENITQIRELTKKLDEAIKNFERAVEINHELNTTLTKDTEIWEGIYQSIVKELKTAIKELNSVKKLVSTLKEEYARKSKVLVELKTILDQIKNKVKDTSKVAKKIKDEFNTFSKDSACYAKLEREIFNKLR